MASQFPEKEKAFKEELTVVEVLEKNISCFLLLWKNFKVIKKVHIYKFLKERNNMQV